MAWNHRSRVVAMGVAIQAASGVYLAPSAPGDLMPVSQPQNSVAIISADDPTATGAIWEGNRIYLGEQATVGATVPLRGPGGAAPFVAGGWPQGRVLLSAGWAEVIKAASSTAALQAGSSTTALVLANTESAVDQFLVGAPIQTAAIGTGFQQTTIIRSYAGASKTAQLPETLGVAPASGVNYTIPAYVSYILGTLTSPPPVLSISIWRDKKRYNYRDWAPASLALNVPVANEANTAFPDMTFSGRGITHSVVDEASPTLGTAVLQVPVAPARNGKFYLDRVKLGHQSLSFTQTATIAAASNQNQAAGQDGFDIISAARAISLDLNQMAVTDFNLESRVAAQTTLPILSTWGMGPGNNWGLTVPNVQLNPFSPGDRNGYVNLTGDAVTVDIDKSAVLTIWW